MNEQPKTFQSKKKNNVVVFLVVSVIIAILAFILISYFIYTFDLYTSYIFSHRFIIASIVGLISGTAACIANKQVIICIDEDEFTYTKGKIIEKYPLDSFAGTYVLRNHMNGAYVGSTRYLRFALPNNTIKQIEIPFEENDYSDIVSLIEKNIKKNRITEESLDNIKEALKEEVRITIPREDLYKAFVRSRKIRALFSALILVVSLTVCITSFILLDLWIFLALLFFFGLLGTTLAIAVFLYGRKESIAAIKGTPSYIVICSDKISFDANTINASEVDRVIVTPPSYKLTEKNYEFRTIVITGINSLDHTFFLGKTPKGDKKMVLKEYPSIVSALEKWCISNNIEFRQDLG